MTLNSIPEFEISLKTKVKASELYKIRTSDDAANICRLVFDDGQIEWRESFVVFCLNRANKVQGYYRVSSGGVTGTVADPRVILQFALLSNASGLILAHNHPSGNLKPSEGDKQITNKIKSAAALLDVQVYDHIIITTEGYFSFADEGIL